MDSRKIESLIEKYWQGACSPEEETLLRHLMIDKSDNPGEEEDLMYFKLLQQFDQQRLDADFDAVILEEIGKQSKRLTIRRIMKAAATALVICTAGFFIYQQQSIDKQKQLISEEAREAFELTKQALYLVSSELNKGTSFAQELDRFDKTFEKIKNEDFKNTN